MPLLPPIRFPELSVRRPWYEMIAGTPAAASAKVYGTLERTIATLKNKPRDFWLNRVTNACNLVRSTEFFLSFQYA